MTDDDPRSGTDRHPELEFHPGYPDRKLPRWFWIMLVVMALAIAGMSLARAEEGVPHVISLYYRGAAYDHVQRTHMVLGDPPWVYESRETCAVAIPRVRVHLSGVTLQCTPHYPINR